uniref:Uncharacterized protein n=1 Tax=Panagrolaimus sp. PS1159 TaxID=55785 RepID=A0AC35FRU7_9BILA
MAKPSYVIATSFAETCIYDIDTSQIASLPSTPKSSRNHLCNSRSFFKSIRELYDPVTVSTIVIPYADMPNSESKSSIIRNGCAFGYDSVQLLSFENASLIRTISAVKPDSKKNNVCIVLFHLREQICATILQFDGKVWIPKKRCMASVKTHHEDLKTFCNNLIENAPSDSKSCNVIICYSKELYIGRKNFFKSVFEKRYRFVNLDKPDEYGLNGCLGGFLTKARILSGDYKMKKYDIANISDWEYKAVADGKDLFKFKVQYQKLPFKKEQKVELYKRHFLCKKWIRDPEISIEAKTTMIKIILEVDHNGIHDFHVTDYSIIRSSSTSHSNVPTKRFSQSLSARTSNLQTTPKRQRSPPHFKHHDRIAFSNIDEERLVFEALASDHLSSASSFSVDEHIEFLVLKDSFKIYHVNEFGHRFPILNKLGKEKTPAYIGLHCLPPVFGEEAQRQLKDHPKSTVYDFIPMFGKEFSKIRIDPKWKFDIVQSKDGRFADIQFETLYGPRRSSISNFM